MFNLQQGKFAFCTSSVSGQAAVGAHHSMAGDKDTDGVVSDGVSYCLGSHVRTSESAGGFYGDFFVSSGFSVGDATQDVPHCLLKRATIKMKRGEGSRASFRKNRGRATVGSDTGRESPLLQFLPEGYCRNTSVRQTRVRRACRSWPQV